MVKIGSVTAEIWTNVARTNFVRTNVTVTVGICSGWPQEPTFKSWSTLGQLQLSYCWYWVSVLVGGVKSFLRKTQQLRWSCVGVFKTCYISNIDSKGIRMSVRPSPSWKQTMDSLLPGSVPVPTQVDWLSLIINNHFISFDSFPSSSKDSMIMDSDCSLKSTLSSSQKKTYTFKYIIFFISLFSCETTQHLNL